MKQRRKKHFEKLIVYSYFIDKFSVLINVLFSKIMYGLMDALWD